MKARVSEWAHANPEALAEGDRVNRAQSAHRIARQLAECEVDCALLREHLSACVDGRGFSVYPLGN